MPKNPPGPPESVRPFPPYGGAHNTVGRSGGTPGHHLQAAGKYSAPHSTQPSCPSSLRQAEGGAGDPKPGLGSHTRERLAPLPTWKGFPRPICGLPSAERSPTRPGGGPSPGPCLGKAKAPVPRQGPVLSRPKEGHGEGVQGDSLPAPLHPSSSPPPPQNGGKTSRGEQARRSPQRLWRGGAGSGARSRRSAD